MLTGIMTRMTKTGRFICSVNIYCDNNRGYICSVSSDGDNNDNNVELYRQC